LCGKLGALPPGPAALVPRTRPSSNGINGLYGHGFYGNGNGYGNGNRNSNGYGTLEIRHQRRPAHASEETASSENNRRACAAAACASGSQFAI